MQPMRYYEYLSSAKVNMLYGQLQHTNPPRGREIGVDVKLFKLSQKTDPQQQGPSIYEKLAKIEEWIYAHEPVGTVDEPNVWIYGQMEVAHSLFDGNRGASNNNPHTQAAVFAAATEDNSYILMGGSAIHLADNNLGVSPLPESLTRSSSFMQHMALLNSFARYDGIRDREIEHRSSNFRWRMATRLAQELLMIDHMESYASATPSRPFSVKFVAEFLAKRLSPQVDLRGNKITLASPLFVALAD